MSKMKNKNYVIKCKGYVDAFGNLLNKVLVGEGKKVLYLPENIAIDINAENIQPIKEIKIYIVIDKE